MALADYFHRSAVAAAQVLHGYDEDAIAERLDATPVAIAADDATLDTAEGRHLLDLTVRLLARLYPHLTLAASAAADPWRDLARAINPAIGLDDREPVAAIVLGATDATGIARLRIHAGSHGWDAHVSTRQPVPLGTSDNPLGAGAAACLAAANLFRHAFFEHPALDDDVVFSTLTMSPGVTPTDVEPRAPDGPTVLVGAGAIGNAALWALARCPAADLIVVDPETVELGNLQRYVLTRRTDEGRPKTAVALDHLPPGTARGVAQTWADFTATHGHTWERVLAAVDSAAARHAIQASLPKWIANAWTQPGDLGVSTHPWTDTGACLSCLYLPPGPLPDEDDLIADALGLSRERDGLQIRNLLDSGSPPPPELLARIAHNLDQPPERMAEFAHRPLRDLYVHGVCGGGLIPLSRVGHPPQNIHVPLAHQSALAGVLLAARLACPTTPPPGTFVTRLDVRRPLPEHPTQPAQKDPRGLCICQDPVYRNVWHNKHAGSAA